MKFKVTCSKVQPTPDRNPFHAGAIHGKSNVVRRTWEFDAESEEDVRKLFNEAKAARHLNVRGFEIDLIEVLPA
ncbi:MAG: hypothetical protein Q7K57_61205 [Burkholderiaceae bacterium]|nr:hypothetical protein [Burkholderiaceae bacterium]